MIKLSATDRRALRARAHSLHPVVAVGQHGLTATVVHEIDVALRAHELIKIRVHDGDRDARETVLARVCEELDAAPVQHVGKLLILFRPKPDAVAPQKRPRAPAPKKKASGTTPRKPRAPHTGGKGAPQLSRHALARFGGDQAPAARKGVSRALAGARSSEFSARTPPALASEAPRRRRRLIVTESTHSTGARNAPTVRRRRKNP